MKKVNKILGGIFITSIIWIFSCGGGGGGGGGENPTPSPVKAKWTFAVYMAGDNNLAMASLQDLMEMEAIGSTKDVKVVVQAEFADEYMTILDGSTLIYFPPQTFNLSTYETSRFKIVKDGDPNIIDSQQIVLGDKDMASSQTLANFIKWVKNNYPAEHYALVLWNHGSGWEGVLQDQTANHYMNMQELKSALEAGGIHFDVIDFDACLMGMYEVAYNQGLC